MRPAGVTPAVYLVHHGAVTMPDAVETGRSRVPLTAEGEAQMDKAGRKLRGLGAPVVSAPTVRTRQSGDVLSRTLGVPHENDPNLSTWDVGEWTGQPAAHVRPLMQIFSVHAPTVAPPGGEPYADAYERWRQALASLLQRYHATGKPPVAVASKGPLLALPYMLSRGEEPLYSEDWRRTIKPHGRIVQVGYDRAGRYRLDTF